MATRILAVGHDAEIRKATSQSLSHLGYEVIGVRGAQAMDAVHSGAPDIVLTEVVMPDKCGIELIREIKRANKDIRIIATSADATLDRGYILEWARKLGADLVLPRPFGIDTLRACIEQALEQPANGDRRNSI
jgi:CheY-like chemotaxis protein